MSAEVKIKHGEPDICRKTEDLIELNLSLGLWLKPISKIYISVALPCTKQTGQCISIVAITEKLKKRIKPYTFKSLKVLKSTLEFIRYEAELESKSTMESVISRLERTSLKLNGFTEPIKVKAAKIKLKSSRHEWETFFRDDPSMDETKPGLRADTIHLKSLPTKWFGGDKPKPQLLLDVFQAFGDIRRYHIPCLDQSESANGQSDTNNDTGFKRFSFENENLTFDAFVMYKDYIGFVKAMDGLMAKKLVKKLDQIDKYLECEFQVEFDKTKHLSDKSIKKRTLLRRYGLKDVKELKDFKEHAKKEKQRYEERFKLLKERKTKAENLLKLLLSGVEKEMEAKKKEEARIEAEKLAKKLLEDEKKEKEKLIEEKRNDSRRKHSSSEHGLKSVAVALRKETKSNKHNLKSIAVPLNGTSGRSSYSDSRYHNDTSHDNNLFHHRHNHANRLNNDNSNHSTLHHRLQYNHNQPHHQHKPHTSNHRSTRLDLPYQRDSGIRNVQRKIKRNRNLLVQVTWKNDE
ncbi:A-kinase anchor protein 17A [Tetranychus urticae]|uniref:A-kinase anchor protein 17A n=1 Tax=Tetranychus urticae TaxID=32264 RepID=T1K1C8_TETUR|nr:A-kinase anchor protein 17A [Tetranychus urticae]XP_015782187.1 A-kinase anchor protein 17A [Tetranychus urticae]XP_015782188.1 A-kinase anchor protein 17A [Tetranychus urticae]